MSEEDLDRVIEEQNIIADNRDQLEATISALKAEVEKFRDTLQGAVADRPDGYTNDDLRAEFEKMEGSWDGAMRLALEAKQKAEAESSSLRQKMAEAVEALSNVPTCSGGECDVAGCDCPGMVARRAIASISSVNLEVERARGKVVVAAKRRKALKDALETDEQGFIKESGAYDEFRAAVVAEDEAVDALKKAEEANG